MIYSQMYLKHQGKVPTIVGVLIACFVGLLMIRFFSQTPLPSKAEKKILKRVEVTNLSPNQVVLYWQTNEKVPGWVIYGMKSSQLDKIAYDERDLITKKQPFIHHYMVLKNLHEDQLYFFKLVGDNTLLSNNNESSFSFKTPKNIANSKGKNPAYGKVIKSNGTPLVNGVVLVSIGNTFPLSALTKPFGEWLIPLNMLFEKETYLTRTLGDKEQLRIEILSEENQVSNIITDLSKVSPLPQTIVIGSNFNFVGSENVLSATTFRETEKTTKEIDIVYPRENALIPGYSPLIKGVGLPDNEVLIEVHSDTVFSSKVKTDDKGVWKLNLPSNLSPGEHTITIKTRDKDGNLITVERKFVIAKNGEQVLGTATPEATITLPLATLTPTKLPIYSLTPKPPVSGGTITTPFIGGTSLIILGLGLILVF
ncbi:fibronectin type III domain-containing protein [Candidatus Roizmanbacteria bacterium]|nr:fibronectin type III domain-containing protein [Candidatus Roizmanbacteria bacterium]